MKFHARIMESVSPKNSDAASSIIIQFVDNTEVNTSKFFVLISIHIIPKLENGIFGNYQLNGKVKSSLIRKRN